MTQHNPSPTPLAIMAGASGEGFAFSLIVSYIEVEVFYAATFKTSYAHKNAF